MKLLVCRTKDAAARAMEALGLNVEEWQPHGLTEMLGGQRFDRIVVVVSAGLSRSDRERQYQHEWINDLSTHLSPGEKVWLI
jgi:hypothetical protein